MKKHPALSSPVSVGWSRFKLFLLLTCAGSAQAAVRYVDANSTNALPPYLDWSTAAATIQQAVDAADAGDEIVVTNGNYATGGRAVGTNVLVNRVAVDKPLAVRSVNGPQATVIRGLKAPGGQIGCGDGASRCVYLAGGASLSGFTLTDGATRTNGDSQLEQSGGGVWCESQSAVVSNCLITRNSAWHGGGAYGGTMDHCTLSTNSAYLEGGGAYGSSLIGCGLTANSVRSVGSGGGVYSGVLSNCTLTGNLCLGTGGGAYSSALFNCEVNKNTAWQFGGGAFDSTLQNCTVSSNLASYFGGGAEYSTLNNCNLAGNSASSGGGASDGTLSQCTLTGNHATSTNQWSGGGGAYASTLLNCTLSNNSAWYGGAVASDYSEFGNPSTLSNCLLTSNSAQYGGAANWSTLEHCTVTGNSAASYGGGAYGGGLSACVLLGNSAGISGGGACISALENCTLTGNSAGSGGGVYAGWLNNCTITGNSAGSGGGATVGELRNCILYFNTAATNGANYDAGDWGTINYSCTAPMPANGSGNITNAPLFVDYNGGNLQLQTNSPCINAGLNAYAFRTADLAGLPRVVNGTVDIGAYEFQGHGSVISYAWLQRYGLPTDGAADFEDPDADGQTTWQEWRCQTDPTNALSALRLVSASPADTNVTVSWQSVAGVNYFLQRTTNLSELPGFALLATNLVGESGTTSYTDTNAAAASGLFYRVGVGN